MAESFIFKLEKDFWKVDTRMSDLSKHAGWVSGRPVCMGLNSRGVDSHKTVLE